ncbi:hypothetical protein CC86DRAFT_410215 [Ophiobolus disseminans]|uniref:Uncharacterized protein n=1 Tax=Ophiobolus disseminans TaxID=1469910 RepID=A0A6A6ZQT3_9PLEO|nr:hypothetical protein CC86DRAFT_410215 [Ophiobolus disseminans]
MNPDSTAPTSDTMMDRKFSVEISNATPNTVDDASEEAKAVKPNYAVHTGLYEPLPADIRLEVYKAEFPEMNRTPNKHVGWQSGGVDRKNVVSIRDYSPCWNASKTIAADIDSDGLCQCVGCWQNRTGHDKLAHFLTSNFARDPAIRTEFLSHYLNLVQFHWGKEGCEFTNRNIENLPAFFYLIYTAGLISAFKHLTLDYT